MRLRFEPDSDGPGIPPPIDQNLINPEAPDSREAQFAASLEPRLASARFEIETPESEASRAVMQVSEAAADTNQCEPPSVPLISAQNSGAWKQEVADRVSKYRARRRPREPRYPSLKLKFEAADPVWSLHPEAEEFAAPATHQSLAVDSALTYESPVPETGRLIEFPRSSTLTPRPLDELAEPVFDRPRIIEAPEVAPPPPALGGILIEPAEEPILEKRPGFEIPLQAAPWSRRVSAVVIDALIVLAALTLFGYIFLRMNGSLPAMTMTLGAGLMAAAIFWSGYQYLLLVYSGSTPGLRLAKLELNRFDGTPVPRRLRRWRVLASILSGASLGLGYAWCFLDEDQLCWHDRITRTYAAPGQKDR